MSDADGSYEHTAYLLQNQLNPFPISGELVFVAASGRLSFTLDEKAAGASLGWLEKALGTEKLKERIQAGELPTVFDLDVKGRKIAWPKTLANVGMKVDDGERTWVVSLEYPSGGAIWQAINMLEGKRRTKPLREALSAAGAR